MKQDTAPIVNVTVNMPERNINSKKRKNKIKRTCFVLPDYVLEALREHAWRNHQSMNQALISILMEKFFWVK